MTFLGKLLEHALAAPLKEHFASNDLFKEFQSEFTEAETAHIRVTTELLVMAQYRLLNILPLDITAVCRGILLHHVKKCCSLLSVYLWQIGICLN